MERLNIVGNTGKGVNWTIGTVNSSEVNSAFVLDRIKNNVYNKRNNEVRKSAEWKTFYEIIDEKNEVVNNFVACKLCGKVLKYNKRSYSNLLLHPCSKRAKTEINISEKDKKNDAVTNCCIENKKF